ESAGPVCATGQGARKAHRRPALGRRDALAHRSAGEGARGGAIAIVPRAMHSTHPDFVDFDATSMTDDDMLRYLRDNMVEPTRMLNAEFLSLDSRRGLAQCRFKIVPAFCHSQGAICQGGFLTGMVDIAMANAALAKGRFACAVPTLELKMSFLEPV